MTACTESLKNKERVIDQLFETIEHNRAEINGLNYQLEALRSKFKDPDTELGRLGIQVEDLQLSLRIAHKEMRKRAQELLGCRERNRILIARMARDAG